MIRRIAYFSVDHRGWVAAISIGLAALALAVGLRLRLDALPDLTNNQVLVLTRAPGLTPEEVERIVTRPVEVALGGVPGLVEHRSLSRYGISSVTVVFQDSVSPWLARQIVTERLLTLSLPDGVERPELGPLSGGLGEIFHLTLSSPRRTPAELLELGTFRAAPLLKAVPGVVEVNSWGGAERTLDLVADPTKLAARGIELGQLRTALAAATGARAAGALPATSGQVLLRAVSRPRGPGDLGAAVVGQAGVRAADLGVVVDGTTLRLGAATANGRGETLYLMVQMLRDENALEVVGRIREVLPELKKALPDDVRVDIVYDRSTLVGGTLRTVGVNLLEGGLLVMLVLFAFLGSPRAGLLVASVIPLSMAFATAAMTLFEVPGNLMSLGALDFGLLVDGAIVMVEGIFHGLHKEGHHQPMPARIREVAGRTARPIFFSRLAILLVYVPVLTLTGVDGKMFRPMALTVVFALLAALALTLTYVPAMASLVLREADVPAVDPLLVRALNFVYPRALGPGLRHRWGVGAGSALLLLAGVWVAATRGVDFTPQLDEGDMVVQTTRRPDISLDEAVVEAQAMEAALLSPQLPEVVQVVSRIGSPAVATDIMGLEQADVFVKLKPKGEWRPHLTREALVDEMDRALAAKGLGGEPAFTQPIQMRFNELLGGAVTDVGLSVYGEDLGELYRLTSLLAGELAKVPGAEDVRVLAPPSVPVVTVRPRALEAAQVGFTAADVMDAVQAARVGLDVGLTYDGNVRIPIRLRLDGAKDAWALSALPLPSSSGGVVPLSKVAEITPSEAPGQVSRRNGERRLVVGFNVRGADLGTVVNAAEARATKNVSLPKGYRLEWGGQYESLTNATRRLTLVVPAVLLLILIVLTLTFSKVRPALAIFTLVPFACVGGVLTLWARGMPISLPAAIGFIALSGIAVTNGVVWVSRTLELEGSGLEAAEAARRSALDRARPVLMTALVAALGFVPMMLATGIGAEVQRPLATVVVGGLVSSTFLTLFVLPALWPYFAGRGGKMSPEVVKAR